MKSDIILAGVGGQGILSIATIIGYAAVESGLFLKQAEVHGMSQRGGDVQSNLRISDKEIYSDLIPEGSADLILSVEPMESLRYLPLLSNDGWLITNTTPFINIPNYPKHEIIDKAINDLPNTIYLNADQIAKDFFNARGMNMVIAGAASIFIDIPFEKMEEGIRVVFGKKGESVVEKNLNCLRAGREYSIKNK